MRTGISAILSLGYGQPPGGYYPQQGPDAYYQPPAQAYYPPYPPAYAPAPYRPPFKPIRPFLSMIIISLIAMIFMIASLATPWYGYYSKSSDYESKAEMSFWDVRSESKSHGSSYSQTETWSKYSDDYRQYSHKDPKLPWLYLAVEILMIFGVVMSVLAFVAVVLRWLERGPARLLNNAGLYLILGVIIGIVSMSVFAATHSWAINDDSPSSSDWGPQKSLIGMHSENGVDSSWTVTTGWFLAIIASIMMMWVFLKMRQKIPPLPSPPVGYVAQPAPVSLGYYQIPPPPQPPGYYPPVQ
jgi:magnesium-transporting ATPase (P-type)